MEKITLLSEIQTAITRGELSKEEVLALFGDKTVVKASSPVRTITLLYYLGGAIIALGLIVLVTQNWEFLSSILRVLFTLGVGSAFLSGAILLAREERLGRLPEVFHMIAGVLIPTGVFVTLNEYAVGGGDMAPGLIFTILMFAYLLIWKYFGNALVLFLSIAYGSFAMMLLTNGLVGYSPIFDATNFDAYRFSALGISWVLLGIGLRKHTAETLIGFLYAIGSIAFLAGTFALGGWKPEQSVFWEIVYPGLVAGTFFAALGLGSRSMLVFASIALVGFVAKITSEYFSQSIGWALSLVIIGIVFIVVGYATYYFQEKYIPKNKAS